jgi:hypothetical protein
VPSRNNEEMAIVVWEQQDRGTLEENIDVDNNVSVHDHKNSSIAKSACVDDEQPFFLSIFMILEIGIISITKQGMY